MILQALHDYYRRKMAGPDPVHRLAVFGLEEKEIPFILELRSDGTLAGIKDTRTPDGKKKLAGRYLVPQGIKKTSGVAANLLWDTAEYVLGLDTKGKPERVLQQKQAFMDRLSALVDRVPEDEGLLAVRTFLQNQPLDAVAAYAEWSEIADSNPVLSFRLVQDVDLVCQRPAVAAAILSDTTVQADDDEPVVNMPCLITGQVSATERLHSAIKGVWGAQTSGANIVSFNLPAFNSYGKAQGFNAPVSSQAAFAYTTALNHLLGKGSRQRMQVGDASAVFWSQEQQDEDVEDIFGELFGESGAQHDDPDQRTDRIRALYESIQSGGFSDERGQHRFYVLGLAPNAARIAVRFWHVATLDELGERIRAWFDDLRMVGRPHDPPYPSLFRLLTAISVQGKADNIPPNLGGDVMRSILEGRPFPVIWLNAAVLRCRAEQEVSYLRAAVIKACLNRSMRHTHAGHVTHQRHQEEFSPMLDPHHPSTAYRLGRLFATLEKIQEEASPGINATIRDRFYGAASSSPITVYPALLRLKAHHLAKVPNRERFFEKLIGEIMDGIQDFPAHMPMADQGRFALGYYHQRQDFFKKHEPTASAQTNQEITT